MALMMSEQKMKNEPFSKRFLCAYNPHEAETGLLFLDRRAPSAGEGENLLSRWKDETFTT